MWEWWVDIAEMILNIVRLLPMIIILTVIMMLRWLTGGD